MLSPIAQISLQEFHPLETKGYVYFFDFDLVSDADINLTDAMLVVFLYSSTGDRSLRDSLLDQGCIFWKKEPNFDKLAPASQRQRLLSALQDLYSGLKATNTGFHAK
jgi:hypothetical protein